MKSFDLLSFYVFIWAYLVIMHAKYGQTLGKMAFKLKVVDAETWGAISIKQAVVREALWWLLPGLKWGIGALWFMADILSPSFNPTQRALHDMAAGTVVLRTNVAENIVVEAEAV
jgi:uncharacterized RDD family membrane protein YckC